MFYQGLKFYSDLGNKLKNINEKKSFEHLLENKSYSYLDSNGEKIKLQFEIEKEKRLFNKFIHNMSNYKKIEEAKRNNYLSRLRGYKNSFEEKKFAEQRKKKLQEIIDLKKRKEKLEGDKMIVNYNDIQSHFENYLNEEKNNNNNKYNMNKEINYRNKDYLSLSNVKSNSFNKKLFLSLNSSSNADSINNNPKKLKFLDIKNSNIMPNIIRKRMHQNKSNYNLFSLKNELNLFNSRLKKDEILSEIYPQIFPEKETKNTNFYSNETNSFDLKSNLSDNIPKKIISNDSNKVRNLKSISNKTKTNNKIIQVNEVNIDLERKLKKKKPLLQIIKDFSNVSFNHKDAIKINPDELFFSQINSVNRNLLAKNKKPLKLKKLKIKSNQ